MTEYTEFLHNEQENIEGEPLDIFLEIEEEKRKVNKKK